MKNAYTTLIFFLIFGIGQSFAQDYKTAAGLRFGSPWALSGKMFIEEDRAIEAILSFQTGTYWNRFGIGGAYLIHKPLEIEGIENLNWYFGFGASIHVWSYSNRWSNYYERTYSNTNFGISGYLGLEYTFKDAPICASLDWAPTLFIKGFNSGFGADYGALAVRYIFSGHSQSE